MADMDAAHSVSCLICHDPVGKGPGVHLLHNNSPYENLAWYQGISAHTKCIKAWIASESDTIQHDNFDAMRTLAIFNELITKEKP
jgi:hypothetical protein